MRLSTRVYGGLLRTILPSLGSDYSVEAMAAFQELESDARRRGAYALLSFWVRETRSLFATAREEWRKPPGAQPGKTRSGGSFNRSGRGATGMDNLSQDIRYSLRRLAGSPGFVLISVFSLSMAIAVSTAAFSVVNAAFFRPIPHVANQDQLVRVFTSNLRMARGPNSYPDFEDYRAMTGTMTEMAALGSNNFSVGQVSRGTRQVWGLEVSENFFQFLGIPLARGRGFLPEDVARGGKVAVIGHNTWEREFDGSPDVLGQVIHLNGQPYTVVGVGPQGMVGPEGPMLLEIVTPLMDYREERGRLSLAVFGRLGEGTSVTQAQAEFDAMALSLAETYPDHWDYAGEGRRTLRVVPSREARVPDGAPLLAILAGVGSLMGLIMLIACSNVANLLLTRAFKRRTEVAVRSAIGAPPRRIFTQLMVENLILFGIAGGLGLLLTHWLASALASGWSLIPIPGFEFSPDLRVAAFAFGLALATGMIFGLIPAFYALRVDLLSSLKGIVPTMRFRFLGVRNLLVGAQVGGSLVMVLVTILLVQSLSHVKQLDLGFDPAGVATLAMDLSHGDYGEEEGQQFFQNLMARSEGLPGVTGVGFSSWVPLEGGSTMYGGLNPEGYEPGPQESVMAGSAVVTPGYLELAGMTLLAGRDFSREDGPGSPEVILVNQSFVDRFWPGEVGVGKRVTFGNEEVREVVGVVADVPYRDLISEVGPHLWLPLSQHFRSEMVFHAKTTGDPRALLPLIRQRVADLDPNLPIVRADLMENVSANATQPLRVTSAALGATGFFTLLLGMLGIYGVVGYSVSQRNREMGLRMALGAEPGRVVRMVLKEGLVISLIGIVPGFLLAMGVGQLIRSLLMGMSPLNPVSYLTGVGLLMLAVMGASLAPGLRAARTQPMESLRQE